MATLVSVVNTQLRASSADNFNTTEPITGVGATLETAMASAVTGAVIQDADAIYISVECSAVSSAMGTVTCYIRPKAGTSVADADNQLFVASTDTLAASDTWAFPIDRDLFRGLDDFDLIFEDSATGICTVRIAASVVGYKL